MDTLLLLASGGKSPPLIDLDSTVFVQLLLFLITAFVLNRLVFRPYLALRAARDAGIDGAKAEAAQSREETNTKLAACEERVAKARDAALAEQAERRSRSAAEDRQLMERAREAAQASLARARSTLASEAEGARREVAATSPGLGREIATKLLGREVV